MTSDARPSNDLVAVYETQSRELWAILYAQCCDPQRAEDALQEAFARLHENRNGTPIRDIRAWVLHVGTNWLRDAARRQKYAATPTDNLDTLAGTDGGPLQRIQQAELFTRVRRALTQMSIEDREVLVLRYALDWSSKRMAEALGLTNSVIDMRLSRARRRLGAMLERAGINHDTIRS